MLAAAVFSIVHGVIAWGLVPGTILQAASESCVSVLQLA